MIEFIVGFASASVLFTFFPTLGLKISAGLRSAWDWVKAKTGIGVAKQP